MTCLFLVFFCSQPTYYLVAEYHDGRRAFLERGLTWSECLTEIKEDPKATWHCREETK